MLPALNLLGARQATSFTTVTDYEYSYFPTATISGTTYSSYDYVSTTYTSAIVIYPLTTVFTPPASCFDPVFTIGTNTNGRGYDRYSVYISSLTYTTDITRTAREECYPPNFPVVNSIPGTFVAARAATYSPGLCPASYTTADLGPGVGGQTIAICCPSGYAIYIGDPYCSARGVTATVISEGSTTTKSIGTILATFIAVEFQSTDSSLLAAATATSATLTTTSATTSSPSAVSIPTGTISSGGLSTGSQAGIGVGVSLGVLAIAGTILAFFLLRRKKRRESSPSYTKPSRTTTAEPKSTFEVDQPQDSINQNRNYEVQHT